jgi:hypothetical protein
MPPRLTSRGFLHDPGYGSDRWHNPVFTALRLEPWRVQVMLGEEYPRGALTGTVWTAD